MPLGLGTSLGSYQVLAALGAGGMGEVYRAKDVKLGRDVALKILPDSFTHDPERVARFRREAQILAALNHPHIGAIYGIDETDGIQFLVLELVDGETLEQRIVRGPAPLDEGLRIADEIADALAAAHEKGVVHRDLKPANIALTRDGRVKVLDFGLAALAVAMLLRRPAPEERGLMRLALDLGPDATPNALVPAALSPDGARVAFHTRDEDGRSLLATRRFDESKITMLIGTEGADQPFFSPDGQWIGFFGGDKLMKVPVQGGTPVALANAQIARGASWGDEGTIVAALSNRSGLSRVPADGGAPQALTTLSPGEPTHRWPQVLPGSKGVLFTANSPTLNSYEDATIDVQSFATGQRKTVWRGGYFGRYVPTSESRGHLLYVRQGVLFAAPFDLDRLEVDGPPAPMLEDIAADPESGAGQYDFSRAGTFIVRTGASVRAWSVAWLDVSGKTMPLLAKPALYYSPRFSPNGRQLAIGIDEGKGADIFIADLQRDTLSRVTFTGRTNSDPVWTPDGKHLLFRADLTSDPGIWWVRADGAGEPVRLMDADTTDMPANSLSPDGRTFIYSAAGDRGDQDLWTVALDVTDPDRPKAEKPVLFFRSPGDERAAAISPDERWVAYQSTEAGRNEVYVRPFSTSTSAGGKWQVSMNGGRAPVWSRTARELFFIEGDRIMVCEYMVANGLFVPSKPRVWSETMLWIPGFTAYDIAPDGKRFAIFQRATPNQSEPQGITLLLNFFDEIRRRSPPP
jgi:serine/threonine protein kinase